MITITVPNFGIMQAISSGSINRLYRFKDLNYSYFIDPENMKMKIDLRDI